MKHLTQYILFESGSIGGNRILRADVKPTVEKYEKEVLQKFPGYKKCEITGSYNAGTKKDHGDIDLCIWIDSKEDIKNVKKEFKKHVEDLPDELTPKFRSGRNQGKKAQLYGSIVTCQIPIVGKEDEFVQIDNIIVVKPEELNFQKSFLNLNAQLQTFDTAIVRVAPDDKKEKAFKHFGIADLPRLDTNQEFEFVLSSAGLSLRKVTLTDERKQKAKEEIWRSVNWEDVTWLLDMILDFKSDGKEYEEMLDRAAEVFKNDERARKRMCGVMKSMINIGPGEVGTPKGEAKEKGIKLAYDKLGVEMNENKIENNYFRPINKYLTESIDKYFSEQEKGKLLKDMWDKNGEFYKMLKEIDIKADASNIDQYFDDLLDDDRMLAGFAEYISKVIERNNFSLEQVRKFVQTEDLKG